MEPDMEPEISEIYVIIESNVGVDLINERQPPMPIEINNNDAINFKEQLQKMEEYKVQELENGDSKKDVHKKWEDEETNLEIKLALKVFKCKELAIYIACSRGHSECVENMWDGISNNLPEGCFHAAIRSGNKDVVSFILGKDSSVLHQSLNGQYPVHIAARENEVEIMKEICSKSSYCLELLNKDGKNALHIAMENECLDMIDYLLEQPRWWMLATEGNDDDGTTFFNITKTMNLDMLRRFHPIITAKGDSVYKRKIVSHLQYLMKIKETHFFTQFVSPVLIVAAALIATIAYQGGINVPGGFDDSGKPALENNKDFQNFVKYNTVTLMLALAFVIMSMLSLVIFSLGSKIPCPTPSWTTTAVASTFIILMSLLFIALAFVSALKAMMPGDAAMYVIRWTAVYSVPIIVGAYCLRLALSMRDIKYMAKVLIDKMYRYKMLRPLVSLIARLPCLKNMLSDKNMKSVSRDRL